MQDCCRALVCGAVGGHPHPICYQRPPPPAPTRCTDQPSGAANVTWTCPYTIAGGSCSSSRCALGLAGRYEVQSKLIATGAFAAIDLFPANIAARTTPTLADLTDNDAVLVFISPGNDWANPTTLGNVLAAYWDAGGGVDVAHAANMAETDIQGAWASGGFRLFDPPGDITTSYNEKLPINRTEPDSPLLVDVFALNASTAYQSGLPSIAPNAIVVARWGSTFAGVQNPLIVSGTKPRPDGSTGNLVELNFSPVLSLLYAIVDAAP